MAFVVTRRGEINDSSSFVPYLAAERMDECLILLVFKPTKA